MTDDVKRLTSKLLAWANLAAQILNGVLLALDKLLGVHVLPAQYETNAVAVHAAIAVGLGIVQAFLEKLDANKNGILDVFEQNAGGALGRPPADDGSGGAAS